MTIARLVAVLFALVPWIFSVLVLLGSLLWGTELRCDDHCSVSSPDWRDREDAWQWNLVPLLGGVAFVAGTILVVCVWRGRAFGAFTALLLGASATLIGGTLLVPGWHEHLARNAGNVVVSVLVFTAGVLAALLATAGRD
jgi:hypothetical protein